MSKGYFAENYSFNIGTYRLNDVRFLFSITHTHTHTQ